MATAVTEMLLTAEEFAALAEPRDGGKMELVGGKVVTFTPVKRAKTRGWKRPAWTSRSARCSTD